MDKLQNLTTPIEHTIDGNTTKYTKIIGSRYNDNHNLAVMLQSTDDQYLELSVNTLTFGPASREDAFVLDSNSVIVNNIKDSLIKQGFIAKIEREPIHSGFTTYPIYTLCN